MFLSANRYPLRRNMRWNFSEPHLPHLHHA
jgi:hypothetical protein